MLAILLSLVVIVMCVYYIRASVAEYKSTQDTAYFWFCTLFTTVLVFVLFGFFHFKPWIS